MERQKPESPQQESHFNPQEIGSALAARFPTSNRVNYTNQAHPYMHCARQPGTVWGSQLKLKLCLALVSSIVLTTRVATPMFAAAESWSALYLQGEVALADQKLVQAESSFRKALAAAESESKDVGNTEKCMLKLADTLALRNKTAEALSLYQKLLGMLEKRYGSNSPQVAPVLLAIGSIQEAAGDHTAAVGFYQRALGINEKNYGPYSPAVAGNLHYLGRASWAAGNRKEGEKHYKRALSILSQDPDLEASRRLQNLMRDYGDLLKKDDNSNRDLLKDFQQDILDRNRPTTSTPKSDTAPAQQSQRIQSLPLPANNSGSAWAQQADFQLKISKDAQTNEDPKVVLRGIPRTGSEQTLAPVFKVMNNTIFGQKHYEKGEDYYKRIIAVDINALGPNHPSVANDLNGLAQLYMGQGRYAEAAPLLRKALAIYEQTYGTNNLLTLNTCATLASAEFRTGNVDRAAELYRRALTEGQTALKPNSLETARVLNELAYLYYHQGKLQEAVTFYQWALASTEAAAGKRSALMAACMKDYAQVLRSAGRTDDATDIESRAAQILATTTTAKDPIADLKEQQ